MRVTIRTALRIGLLTAILAAALTVSASALTEGDWEFQLLDNEVQITDYHGSGGNVVVPSTLHGSTVTEIKGFSMFVHKATSLTIPGTIKNIEVGAHYGWDELESLTLGEGVQSIDGCILQKYPNLRSVTLPSTLKKLGEYAFLNSGITQIKLPAGLEVIGQSAFAASSLKSVDLSGLRSVTLDTACFENCKNLSSVLLPSSLTTIPQSFVENCEKLTSIDIPASVTTIKTRAFSSCGLTQVYLPTSLKTLEPGAFNDNPLTEVIVPYGVTTVGSGGKYIYGVFDGCSSLKAVYLPDTVTTMGTSIISDCPDCIIYCSANSYVAQQCQKNAISYSTDSSVNSSIHVLYNGKRISFAATGQNPVILNNRTLVPLRAIFETMGAAVDWDAATRTVTATRGSDTIKLTLGDTILYKNGKPVMTMDVPARTLNNRTVVPARAVAEAFGAQVGWVNSAHIVTISE